MRRCIALGGSLAAVLALAGTATARAPGATAPLIAQRSCTEARNHLLDWAAYWAVESQLDRYDWAWRGGANDPTTDASAAGAGQRAAGPAGAARPATGPRSYTATNLQEAGVDEADLVKTDGKYVYTVNGRDVVIVRIWPATRVEVVARLALPASVTPQSLLLAGNRLVVLSYVSEQIDPPSRKRQAAGAPGRATRPIPDGGSTFNATRVSVVDVADRARPRLVHQADVEGNLGVARRIGDDIYVVSNAAMQVPTEVIAAAQAVAAQTRPDGTDGRSSEQLQADKRRAFRAVRAHLVERFDRLGLTAAMPRQRHGDASGRMWPLRPLYGCADLHVPPGGGQLGTLNVVHFDVDQPQRIDAVGLMASGWQVYASTDALYAAMPDRTRDQLWGWGPPAGAAAEHDSTSIHAFDLRGPGGRPRYAASGRVRGHILDPFSMSEQRGFLRVATTDAARAASGQIASSNHLYVLGARGRRLAVVGAIEDLAPGERIFSARLTGDTGTLVTFRQTDPLFTLDLSDPRRPRVAGELKMDGFSSYIHPLDRDHLLTIGQDAGDDGRVQGVHVQVFDISDPAHPRRTAHRRLTDGGGWSWSAAQWDHHAFTYDPRTGVLAVPMSSYSSDPSPRAFLGLVMLRVASDSLEELGRISHTELARSARAAECQSRPEGSGPCAAPLHQDWRAQIVRSIVIDDAILSLSTLGLQLDDLRRPGRALGRVLLTRLALTIAG